MKQGASSGFLLGLFFNPKDVDDVPPKRGLNLNGIHRCENLKSYISTFCCSMLSAALTHLALQTMQHRYSAIRVTGRYASGLEATLV
jgi:hypothetical protein